MRIAADECYRCGYDLRGVANEGACPECGLLAERSRRVSDELHDTRPRWLRSLSRGIDLILLAMAAPFAGPVLAGWLAPMGGPLWKIHLSMAGYDLSVLLLLCGVIFFTREEGYRPADEGDARERMLLRWNAVVPVLWMIVVHVELEFAWVFRIVIPEVVVGTGLVILAVVSAFLPLRFFLRLRGLAVRVRSAHLAEHCKIVGIGATGAVLYVIAASVILINPGIVGLDHDWNTRSTVALVVQLMLGVLSILAVLWSLYLLVRFAIAFWIASRRLHRKWVRDDRSAAVS